MKLQYVEIEVLITIQQLMEILINIYILEIQVLRK